FLTTALSAPEAGVIEATRQPIALTGYSSDHLQFVETEQTDLVRRLSTSEADLAAASTRLLDQLSAGRTADAAMTQKTDVGPVMERLELLTNLLVTRAQSADMPRPRDTRDAY